MNKDMMHVGCKMNEKMKLKTKNKTFVGFFFFLDSTQAQIETRILGLILIVWWTRLGSPQLYWADYEPSCAQNMDLTIHTYLYIQNIYILHSREQ